MLLFSSSHLIMSCNYFNNCSTFQILATLGWSIEEELIPFFSRFEQCNCFFVRKSCNIGISFVAHFGISRRIFALDFLSSFNISITQSCFKSGICVTCSFSKSLSNFSEFWNSDPLFYLILQLDIYAKTFGPWIIRFPRQLCWRSRLSLQIPEVQILSFE